MKWKEDMELGPITPLLFELVPRILQCFGIRNL